MFRVGLCQNTRAHTRAIVTLLHAPSSTTCGRLALPAVLPRPERRRTRRRGTRITGAMLAKIDAAVVRAVAGHEQDHAVRAYGRRHYAVHSIAVVSSPDGQAASASLRSPRISRNLVDEELTGFGEHEIVTADRIHRRSEERRVGREWR